MPVVQVYVWTGFSDEAKRRVISGITRVFAEAGVPPEAVEIIIHEVPKEKLGSRRGAGKREAQACKTTVILSRIETSC